MKILHLPTAVGGNSWGLAQGEKLLGLESKVLASTQDQFHYPCDINLGIEQCSQTEKLRQVLWSFIKIRGSYDVFHFNFGSSLLHAPLKNMILWDLPFYSRKAKIVVTYNGCDARQKYPTIQRTAISACAESDCYDGLCSDGYVDRQREKSINKFSRYADVIFALNPDLLYFLPEGARFLPYTIAHWANIEHVKCDCWNGQRPLRVVHAPTNRVAKGSKYVFAALDQIKIKYGDRIELVVVEGLSHEKALEIYATADLVIDQVLIGWYGAFAVEVMKMGIPVMAYIREEDLFFLPPKMAKDCIESIINVSPDSIYEKMISILEQPKLLESYRLAAEEYVNRWHNPLYVADITKAVYES